MRVLVINCGSSTLKFQLIDIAAGNTGSAPENRLAHGVIEHIGGQASMDCVADQGWFLGARQPGRRRPSRGPWGVPLY